MATMTHRSTFSLDEITTKRIRNLASAWKVSQAEVIRRAVASADAAPEPDPLAMLEELHQSAKGLSAEVAEAYLAEVRADRQRWRKQ